MLNAFVFYIPNDSLKYEHFFYIPAHKLCFILFHVNLRNVMLFV